MTAIVGIAKDGKVWMGADSQINYGNLKMPLAENKIFLNGPVLCGCAGDYRFTNIVQHNFKAPIINKFEDAFEYMVKIFIPVLRETIKESGWMKIENNREEAGHLLVGVKGRLFEICDDFSVTEVLCEYNAIGSGSNYMLGSLYNSAAEEPEQRILRALATAAAFDSNSAPPFVVKSI
jgi:ATP-dependent protease HslVU (ClpYQ) peptidase subunit